MIKKLCLYAVISTSLICIVSLSISAQDKRLSSGPQAFQTFFAKFMAAVKRGDKAAVASMSQFPLTYGFDAGDEGKYSRQQFVKKGFTNIFGKKPTTFLPEKDPLLWIVGRDYTITTDSAEHISFAKHGKAFLFTSYVVEP